MKKNKTGHPESLSVKSIHEKYSRSAATASPSPQVYSVSSSSIGVNWTNNDAATDDNAYQTVFISQGTGNSIVLDPNHFYYNYKANNRPDFGGKYNTSQDYDYRNNYPLPYDNYKLVYIRQDFQDYTKTTTNNNVVDYTDFNVDNNNYAGGLPGNPSYEGPCDKSGNWVCIHNSTLNDVASDYISGLSPNTQYTIVVINWHYDSNANQFIYNSTIDATNSIVVTTTPPALTVADSHASLTTRVYGDSTYFDTAVSGSNLISGVNVTAPAGFLVKYVNSQGDYTAYVPSFTIAPDADGSVNSRIVLKGAASLAAGTHTGTVLVHTNGADADISIDQSTVTPAPLTISAAYLSRLYGRSIVTDTGYNHFSSFGLVNGETIGSVSVLYGAGGKLTDTVNVYHNSIIPSAATGGTFTAGNYTITYISKDIKVIPAPLHIKPSVVHKYYGQLLTAGIVSQGFTSDSLMNGETIGSISLAYTSGSNATDAPGTYKNSVNPSAAAGGTFTAGNYLISYMQNDVMVSPAPLTVTASDTTKNYGSTLQNMASSRAFIATGLQNQESIGSVAIQYGTGRAAADAVGRYISSVQISAAMGGTANLNNYTLTYINGSIQVIAINPVVSTPSAGNITSSHATLTTSSTDGGAMTTVTLLYSTDSRLRGAATASFSTGTSPLSPGSGKTRFISTLTGLLSGTTYYYQVSATNSAGTAQSQLLSFTTLSTNASLASAALSSGSLSPVFSTGVYAYSSIAASSDNSISLSLLTAEPNATIEVNGMYAGNSSPVNLPLIVGDNAIRIQVTAQDGITQLSYLITVHRVIAIESIVAGNVLSPNNDGHNDYWIVKDLQYYPNNKVTVYDRLGRVVYTKNGYANDWGGTLHGSLLNEDTYYYLVDFGPGERKMKGFITLVRDH